MVAVKLILITALSRNNQEKSMLLQINRITGKVLKEIRAAVHKVIMEVLVEKDLSI